MPHHAGEVPASARRRIPLGPEPDRGPRRPEIQPDQRAAAFGGRRAPARRCAALNSHRPASRPGMRVRAACRGQDRRQRRVRKLQDHYRRATAGKNTITRQRSSPKFARSPALLHHRVRRLLRVRHAELAPARGQADFENFMRVLNGSTSLPRPRRDRRPALTRQSAHTTGRSMTGRASGAAADRTPRL